MLIPNVLRWLAAAASACACTAWADDAPAPTSTPLPAVTVRPAPAGLIAALAPEAARAVRDKETGQLRAASAEEMKDILRAEREARVARGLPADVPATPVVVRRMSNGALRAALGEEHMVHLQARRDAAGRLVIEHDKAGHDHAQTPAAAAAADR